MQYNWLVVPVEAVVSFNCKAMNGIGDAERRVRIFFDYEAAKYFSIYWPWYLFSSCVLFMLLLLLVSARRLYHRLFLKQWLLPMAPGPESFAMRDISYVYDMEIDQSLFVPASELQVLSIIDQGFFGSVYLATKGSSDELVVIKKGANQILEFFIFLNDQVCHLVTRLRKKNAIRWRKRFV